MKQERDAGPGVRRDAGAAATGAGALHLAGPVLVAGLGDTGLSCIGYLLEQGFDVRATDTRARPPALDECTRRYPSVPVHTGGFAAELFAAAGTVVVSPGISLADPSIAAARDAGVPVLGDIELFARVVTAPVLAVTGSNGKSTVAVLVAEMARSAGRVTLAGGNLGPVALELLREEVPDLYVLELSSFQLESTTSLAPAAAAILNVSPDHLDRYDSVADYAAAKARIYRNARVAVVNRDDETVVEMAREAPYSVGFTLGEPAAGDFGVRAVQGVAWIATGHRLLMQVDALSLPGRHNLANALAALALGSAVGLPPGPMIGELTRFAGLPHRCQLVGERGGVRWINDSKGTNVGATAAAIDGLASGRNVVWIAGGLGKEADFTPLAGVAHRSVKEAILFGRDAPAIEAALGAVAPVSRVDNLDEAAARAADVAGSGDVVLFSPACASFDMFESYVARGEAFVRVARGWIES